MPVQQLVCHQRRTDFAPLMVCLLLLDFIFPISYSFSVSTRLFHFHQLKALEACSNKRRRGRGAFLFPAAYTRSPRKTVASAMQLRLANSSSNNTGVDIASAMRESSFPGAGAPRPDLPPEDIPSLLMEALVNNDFPTVDAGLNSVWEFATDTMRFIFKNNRTDFIVSAHETADKFPTSFYGAAMRGKSWKLESPLNRVGGEDGWIATQVMQTISSDGRLRRWQWELRKKRQPPGRGNWFVESVGSSDRKGQFEPD